MRGKKGARSVPPQPPPLPGGEMVALRRVRAETRAVRGAKSEILVEMIRRQRDEGKQELAWHDKRFVLCSLPIKRPPKGSLSYIRRNGNVTLSPGEFPVLGLWSWE